MVKNKASQKWIPRS